MAKTQHLMLQIRKLSSKEVKRLAQGRTASLSHRWSTNPCLSNSYHIALSNQPPDGLDQCPKASPALGFGVGNGVLLCV